MDKLFNHRLLNTPASPGESPKTGPPILQKIIGSYRLLHEFLDKIPKTYRYTLGARIDNNFIEFGEEIVSATYTRDQQKFNHLALASRKLDSLNFLLKISWEIRILDTKKYAIIGQAFAEIGRMLGGWQKQAMK